MTIDDEIWALARLHAQGRVLSRVRYGCERGTRCEPPTTPTPDATPLWEDA